MALVAPSLPFELGEIFAGKYRIDRFLGEGGMGVVLAATHVDLGERVALKFLLPVAATNPEVVARFLREAQAAVRIKNEHVARVIDVGRSDSGTPYIVMEYLAGTDLADLVHTKGPLPIDVAAEYVLQACEAIAEAHAMGIVHRDLKPSNLFVTERRDGSKVVKVLDFGLATAFRDVESIAEAARLTSSTAVLGSPGYMSPEQIRDARKVDVRTDIWSLGVIFYELVTGCLPFRADTLGGMLAAIVSDPHVPLEELLPNAPSGLSAVVDGCLQKRPEKRFHSIAELARALVGFAPPHAAVSLQRVSATLEEPLAIGDTVPGPPSVVAISASPVARTRIVAVGEPETATRTPEFAARTLGSWESDSTSGRRRRRGAAVAIVAALAVAGLGAVFLLRRGGEPTPTTNASAPPRGGASVDDVPPSPGARPSAMDDIVVAPVTAGASPSASSSSVGALRLPLRAGAAASVKPTKGPAVGPVVPPAPMPMAPPRSDVETATDSRR